MNSPCHHYLHYLVIHNLQSLGGNKYRDNTPPHITLTNSRIGEPTQYITFTLFTL